MKHQSYIRSLFVAFCAFFVCVSAMAETTATTATGQLNPFAFKLSNVIPDKDAEGNLMQDYVNVTYRLNADATSAVIRFWYAEAVPAENIEKSTWSQSAGNTGQYIAEYPLTGEYLKKGEHTYKVDFTDLIGVKGGVLDTKKVRWTIDVKGGNEADKEYEEQTMSYYTEGPNNGSFSGKKSATHTVKVLNANKVDREYLFVMPSGIDIDVNPYSDNFGMIYTTESRLLTNGTNGNYTLQSEAERLKYFTYWGSSGDVEGGTGLYVFDAAFQNMPPSESNYDFENPKTDNDRTIARGYDMGLSRDLSSQFQAPFTTWYKNSSGNVTPFVRPLGPRKIRLSDDGSRLFITFFTTDGLCLAEGRVARLGYSDPSNKWISQVISTNSDNLMLDADDKEAYLPESLTNASYYTSYAIETNGGAYAAGPNIAFDTYGKGNALKLLMLSGTRYSIEPYLREAFRCDEYNLGNLTVWNTVSSTYTSNSANGGRDIFTRQMNGKDGSGNARGFYQNALYVSGDNGDGGVVVLTTSYERSNLEYDQNGGFWFSVSRLNTSDMASLVHFDANKNITFTEFWAGRDRAGIRYNHAYDKLLVSGGPYNISWHSTSGGAKRNVKKGTNSDGKTVYGHPQAIPGWATIYTVNKAGINNKYVNDVQTASWQDYMYSSNAHRESVFTDSVYLKLEDGMTSEDFAWDFADNIYIAGGFSNGKIVAYALPHYGKEVSTPCKEEYEFRLSPVHEFYTSVNPTVDGADKYATIIHERIGKEPYEHYLNKAKMDLRADVINGCKFYQWKTYGWDNPQTQPEVKTLRTYPKTDGNTFLQDGLTEQLEVIAEIGICVYEHEAPLAVKAQTTFPAAFVKRELDDISYSTICLPFHLESLAGTPYQGASVLELTSSTTNTDGDSRVFLNFEEVVFGTGEGMRAGKPYLIQLPKGKQLQSEEIFTDVTCPVLSGTNACGGLDVDCGNDITFHGLLNPTTFDEDEIKDKLFLTADNRLVSLYGQNSFSINGLRGYFTVSGAAQNVEFVLNLPEKVTTSIPMVNMADSLQVTKYLWNGQIYIQRGNEVYDLSGARVK